MSDQAIVAAGMLAWGVVLTGVSILARRAEKRRKPAPRQRELPLGDQVRRASGF